jgi:hypothetical protein
MFRLNDFIKYLKENKIGGAFQGAIGEAIRKDQAYISQIKKGERPFLDEYIPLLSKRYGDDIISLFYSKDSDDNICTNKTETTKILEIIQLQQSQISKSQEQIDRLITIIEKSKI